MHNGPWAYAHKGVTLKWPTCHVYNARAHNATVLFGGMRALEMHLRRVHGKRCEAHKFVIGSVCPTCNADFSTRPRVIARMMRGTLRCALAWRTGMVEQFPDEIVAQADEVDRHLAAQSRRTGSRPGTGIPFIPSLGI